MNGAGLITVERTRQIEVEEWLPQHDDEHIDCQLGLAARAYIHVARCQIALCANVEDFVPYDWPVDWPRVFFKPSADPIRNLVKAGALIAAEIDRLQRRDDNTSSEMAIADAKLIAAAPEMAEMLLQMVTSVSHSGPTLADAEALLRKAGVM